jgi:TonB family protein
MLETTLQIIDALGWTLLHSVWQGAVIAAALWLALAALRDASAATRYALVGGAVLLFALSPLATFFIVFESHAASLVTQQALITLSPASIVSTSEPSSLFAEFERFLPLMVLVWTIGVLLRATRVAVEWRRASSFLADGALAPDQALQQSFDRLVAQIAPRLNPVLMISDRICVPSVVGWLKPVVLLPTSVIAGLSPIQLELILAHELAHIRRHDYLINLMQIVLETLMFYHPAVHWMSRLMRDLREECCDDIVVARRGERVAYARALADLESLRQHDGAICMAATGGQLFERITRIALPKQHRGHAPWSTGLIISATAAIVMTTGGTLLERTGGPEAEDPLRIIQVSERYEPLSTVDPVAVDSVAPLTLPRSSEIETQSRIASAGPEVEVAARPMTAAPLALDLEAMEEQVSALAPSALVASVERPSVVTGGAVIAQPSPEYPRGMERTGRGAVIEFEFTVTEEGRVADVRFLDSAPEDRGFRNAVSAALEDWRFEPFLADGEAISQRVRHALQFRVTDTSNGGCGRITGSRVCRSARSGVSEFGVSVVYRGTN